MLNVRMIFQNVAYDVRFPTWKYRVRLIFIKILDYYATLCHKPRESTRYWIKHNDAAVSYYLLVSSVSLRHLLHHYRLHMHHALFRLQRNDSTNQQTDSTGAAVHILGRAGISNAICWSEKHVNLWVLSGWWIVWSTWCNTTSLRKVLQ